MRGRHLAPQAWPRPFVTSTEHSSLRPFPASQAITRPHSLGGGGRGEGSHGGGGGSRSRQAPCAFLPMLSRRSEVILSAPPGCLAFYVFVLFFFKTMKYDKWLFQEAKHKCSLEQWFLNVTVLSDHPGTRE